MQILTGPMQAIIIYFSKDISFRYSACSASILNKNALKSSSAWKQKEYYIELENLWRQTNKRLKSCFLHNNIKVLLLIVFNWYSTALNTTWFKHKTFTLCLSSFSCHLLFSLPSFAKILMSKKDVWN